MILQKSLSVIVMITVTLTADTASFTMDEEGIDVGVICMEVNGTTPITPGKYKALYEPVSLAGYNVPTQNFGVVSELVKNGSTAQKTFVLNDSDATRTVAMYGSQIPPG